MTAFNLKLSAFSVCWLRAYDFGLERDGLERALLSLKINTLVNNLRRVARANEIDEIDALMFDVRYQERSTLMRVGLQSFAVVDQDLGTGKRLSGSVAVNLLLDLASGFGVLDLSLPRMDLNGAEAYTMEEVVFLTSQWLLTDQLQIRLPLSDQVEFMYMREAMNFYFLRLHKALWEAADPERYSPLSAFESVDDWLNAGREDDPLGCNCLRELNRLGLTRSVFPTSFGPIVDVWAMEGKEIDHFDANAFSTECAREIAWLFTDGQRDNLGESTYNERQTKSLALFVWPNHALYINQIRNALSPERIRHRVEIYGCLDVEVIRILEIINLQSALLHAFDRQLDRQLEEVTSLTAQDQGAVIRVTEQRRNMTRLMGSFDFFNLFHTAYWEPLYARLLGNAHLKLIEATNLVEMKSRRLDEEIQKTVVIQDRKRQQQEREQELDVLRGLHGLSLANDIQSSALLIINFIVSATASFAFTEVLSPWLTRLLAAKPSFPEAYPLAWVGLNIGIFMLVTLLLAAVSKSLIRSRSRLVELDGGLNSFYDSCYLEAYLRHNKDMEYFHLDMNERTGYIRVRKHFGVLLLEFDAERFYRYILLWQAGESPKLEAMKRIYIEDEVRKLTGKSLLENARQVLAGNDLGTSTKPSPKLYPHQWNWDSAFIALGLAHFHVERAETEIRSLIKGQWKNGMIPQIIYSPNASGYFPDPKRWDISRSQAAPSDVVTSGITQPPVLTIAVLEITRHSLDTAFAREVFPALLAYHRWFHHERDPRGKGLVSIIHPWESGLDNSPRWAKILDHLTLLVRPTYQREDNRHVSSSERPSNAEYDRFVYLMDLARDLGYSQREILLRSPFVVQDVLVNSILFRADDCLRELARMIGEPTIEIEGWMEATRRAFAQKLWHETDAMYYDYDVRGKNLIRENTIASFLPLYAGLVSEKQAQLLVEKHLMNPSEYAPDGKRTKFHFPTVSKTSPYYDPRRYWRGPIWVNMNWLIIQGLERYGYANLARQVCVDTYDLVLCGGFAEYFNPKTGEGYGTKAFSWSAALVIDMLVTNRPLLRS